MKLRCAVLDDYQNIARHMADWSAIEEQVDVEFLQHHIDDEEELIRQLEDYEILVIMRERTRFGASILSRLPKLKLLVTTGMRNASIDLSAATEYGIKVCGTGAGGDPTTELTWALILGLARNVVQEHQALRSNGPWQSTIGTDLQGKRLGLLGLGKLGSRVARIGQAFGMEVCAWSQNLMQERAEEAGVKLAPSKEELLASSDFVSIHLVLGERTRGLIGRKELQVMRPTAYLINTSRAPIIDQDALVEALQKGWIAGAGLDVYMTEPLPKNDPFRSLPNVLSTPHLGYVSEANYKAYFQGAIEDIQAFLQGEMVRQLNT
ncbi:D-2-hydroxyacid dehydrogenase family protein [Paenibacillus hexagrammi]|uniref:D-2-hydroxyacid dehydrogenase family protein n=1 Tax=Paenibacillus hexagrammi TaxID=2908839 RepID=A0ABY3SRC7_9BACL|nr:D-2-hydroxyacid dehydrogenase family protein [Paenibacillus sp. YPD9-1]UJF35814.1 D-2-hydroxyacid dehydrogenase family protein [Paenibacillus sp. YPD9-1]